MRTRRIASIAVVAVVVIAAATIITRADLPQASLSPDRVLKGTAPIITITLDKSISDQKDIKSVRVGGQVVPVQEPRAEGKLSVLLPKLDIVGRADVEVIGKDDKPVSFGQLTYVEAAEPPPIPITGSSYSLLFLYLVLVFTLPLSATIYDIFKSYKERSEVLGKLPKDLAANEIKELLVNMDQGPTGLLGLTRGIIAVTLILVLGVAVFHLVVFSHKVPDVADKLLMLLAGTLTAITGFYFGSKATATAVPPTGSSEGKTAVPQMKIANFKVEPEKAKPGDKFTIAAEISGGKAPYDYTISFTPDLIPNFNNKTPGGKIVNDFTVPQSIAPGTILQLTIHAKDTTGQSVDSESPMTLSI